MNAAPRASPPKQQSNSISQYSVVSEDYYRSDLGKYQTYGIQVASPDCTSILHDVSVCKETSELIVELLNRHQVSPVHLYDVVTDLLP